MLNLLQNVVTRGTAIRMRNEPYNFRNQIGGKTGTTQNHSNGWFMGVTPNLVGGVWTDGKTSQFILKHFQKGREQIWHFRYLPLFLKKVYADPQFGIMEADEFERPANFNMELDCEKVKRDNSSRDNYSRGRY